MRMILSFVAGFLLAISSTFAASPPATSGRLTIMAVGRIPAGARDTLITAFNRAFLKLGPGDALIIYDSVKRSLVARIDVPNEPRFSLAESRKKHFQGSIKNIRAFLDKDGATGHVIVPELFDELARHLKTDARDRRTDLLLVGEALHFDGKEPAFSMRGGLFPSDGYIAGDEQLSPFGAVNRRNLLANMDVYFCHTDPREHWSTSLHLERVERAWSLYASELGATVATFTHDLTRCTSAFLEGRSSPPKTFTLDRNAKPQMLRAPVRTADLAPSGRTTAQTVDADPDAFLKDSAALSRRPPPSATCQAAKIGIRWANPVDIDLYARMDRSLPYLFFGHVATVEGRYNHDWTASPDAKNALEFIEFSRPFNLEQADVWLNFYSGNASPGPSGEIRVFCDGKVFQGTFKFEVTQGNRASGLNLAGTMTGPHWLRVNIAKLVGVPERRAAR